MSLSALNIAAGALRASQLGVDITGQNISGADKTGYTRQTVATSEVEPGVSAFAQQPEGAGVTVDGVQRVRDSLLDGAYRAYHQTAEADRTLEPLAGQLESLLSTSPGLDSQVTSLTQSLEQAAGQPADAALRTDVLSNLQSVTSGFNSTAASLQDLADQADQQGGQLVSQANSILDQLAQLNVTVNPSDKTGGQNAVLDQRDQLLDKLSGLLDVRLRTQPSGAVAVYLDGRQLLYGQKVDHLKLTTSQTLVTASGAAVTAGGGSIAAVLSFVNQDLSGFQQRLDSQATTLRDNLNALNEVGYDLSGAPGGALLAGTGAADLSVQLSDPNALAGAVATMEGTAPLASGTIDPTAALSSQTLSVTPAASGTVDVNGSNISWSSGESLQSILDSFSAAGVSASYDQTSGTVVLDRDPSVAGPPQVSISDVSGNLSQVLGLATATSRPAIPGNGEVLSAMAQNLNAPDYGPGSDRSFAEAVTELGTDAGSLHQQVLQDSQRQDALETDAQQQRQQASGVSSDEELLNLQRYQQSYAAAARVANTADSMMSTLLSMGGAP